MSSADSFLGLKAEARVKYMDSDFQVMAPGDFVRCAVTGKPIPLSELKEHPALADFRLNKRGNRLSIFPVDKEHWDVVLSLE